MLVETRMDATIDVLSKDWNYKNILLQASSFQFSCTPRNIVNRISHFFMDTTIPPWLSLNHIDVYRDVHQQCNKYHVTTLIFCWVVPIPIILFKWLIVNVVAESPCCCTFKFSKLLRHNTYVNDGAYSKTAVHVISCSCAPHGVSTHPDVKLS